MHGTALTSGYGNSEEKQLYFLALWTVFAERFLLLVL